MKQLKLITLLLFYCLLSNIARSQNQEIMWKSVDKVEYTNDEAAIKKLVLLKRNSKAKYKNENISFKKKEDNNFKKESSMFIDTRYSVFYKKIKVEFNELIVHRKEGIVQSITGAFDDFEEVDTAPKLTLEEIKNLFKNLKIQDIELVIIPSRKGRKPILAYKVMTLEEYNIYVNANSGTIEFKSTNIFNCHSTHEEADPIREIGPLATLDTKAYGQKLLQTKQQSDGTYILNHETKNIAVYDGREGVDSRTFYVDNDNNWTTEEYDNDDKDIYAMDAYYAAGQVYDFFQTKLNRDGLNGQGGIIELFINEDTRANASWKRTWQHVGYSVYGDGSSAGQEPHVNVGVVAHECGHGYIISKCNLLGGALGGEAGAINESIADIIAACTMQYLNIPDVWAIRTSEKVNRRMNNPKSLNYPDTYLGEYYTGIYPHQKGAVFSYWFFLLSEGGSGTNDNGIDYNVEAIGMDNALFLVDRMLSAYFSSNTKYKAAGFYSLLAAVDLYSGNSDYLDAILEAGIATGIVNDNAEYPIDTRTEIWLEAECATQVGSNFQIINNPNASEGSALQYTGSTDHNLYPTDIDSKIYFDINFLSAGIYRLSVLVSGEDNDHDSFFLKRDYRNLELNGWGVNNPNSYSWHTATVKIEVENRGVHRLEFGRRENGAIIDKIHLELDHEFNTPVGFGMDATNCPTMPPSNTPIMEIGSCISSATELSYTSILGTSGSWRNSGDTKDNVFDGNTNTFFDAPDNDADNAWAGLDFGSEKEITCITYRPRRNEEDRMQGGRFEIANDANFRDFTVIYNIPSDEEISFQDYTIKSDSPISARYIRYVSPNDSWGNVAEITVNGNEVATPPNTPIMEIGSCISSATELSYTSILGTSGSWRNSGDTKDNVFDGNTNTFFDAPDNDADNAWAGLDFGSEKEITCITYRPRRNEEDRMQGGRFEIANDANFTNSIVIYNIPSDETLFFQDYTIKSDFPISARYIRYVSPNDSWGNVAEITVNGNEIPTISFSFSDTKSKDIKNTIFRIYPNPSYNFLTLKGLNKHEGYSIYDVFGKEVKNGIISNLEKIDIRNLNSGIYFLKFDNGRNTIKFIKE